MSRQVDEGPRIIVALDFDCADAAMLLVERLSPDQCRLKVGKELFAAAGPDLVRRLVDCGFDVFLDLKYHDIPSTVAAACRVAARLGVWMLNVHALGGRRMMEAARDAVSAQRHGPLLTAVTVLTSHDAGTLGEIGCDTDLQRQVLRLAKLANTSGLDGLVCSGREAPMLREGLGAAPLLVTPGIRPLGSASHDQQRVLTPVQALRAGSDFLVIGRPVTRAADPAEALIAMNREIREVFDSGGGRA